MNNEDYGIVIGINSYREGPPFELKAAERDAVQFLRWLRSPDGGAVPKRNTCVFLSRFYPPDPRAIRSRPMKADIDDALQSLGVDQSQRVGRRLYFYFAGHGLGPSLNDVGLLMANATHTTLGNSMAIFDYLTIFINRAPFDEVILLLDCCRDIIGSYTPQPAIFDHNKLPDSRQVKYMIAVGSRYGEKSWELKLTDTDWRPRCIFTTAVLQGLKEGVDDNGAVTADSLQSYLNERIPAYAEEKKRRQRPEIRGEFLKDIILRPAGSTSRPTIQIPIPNGWQGTLHLWDNQRELSTYTISPGGPPWQEAVPPGLYYVRNETGEQKILLVEPGVKEAAYVELAHG